MGKRSTRDQKARDALDWLYRALPEVTCQQRCQEACGSIVLTEHEARRLQETTHRKPRTIPVQVNGYDKERCIYLDARGKCGAYAVRPLICRAWGVLKILSCPHGCAPEAWLDNAAFLKIGQAVEAVGGRMVRTAPDGLVRIPGDSFRDMGEPTRSAQARAEDEERTRGLRAIHGGRIIIALDHTRE